MTIDSARRVLRWLQRMDDWNLIPFKVYDMHSEDIRACAQYVLDDQLRTGGYCGYQPRDTGKTTAPRGGTGESDGR